MDARAVQESYYKKLAKKARECGQEYVAKVIEKAGTPENRTVVFALPAGLWALMDMARGGGGVDTSGLVEEAVLSHLLYHKDDPGRKALEMTLMLALKKEEKI